MPAAIATYEAPFAGGVDLPCELSPQHSALPSDSRMAQVCDQPAAIARNRVVGAAVLWLLPQQSARPSAPRSAHVWKPPAAIVLYCVPPAGTLIWPFELDPQHSAFELSRRMAHVWMYPHAMLLKAVAGGGSSA